MSRALGSAAAMSRVLGSAAAMSRVSASDSAPFFVFRGFLSLEPIGLPRFRRVLDSVAT